MNNSFDWYVVSGAWPPRIFWPMANAMLPCAAIGRCQYAARWADPDDAAANSEVRPQWAFYDILETLSTSKADECVVSGTKVLSDRCLLSPTEDGE
ncbi:MAG: hypothetical protein IJM59_01945 [Proteobacteria bacterium]|jgi:hypothetical protein|nr:hypothetical protein [Pseudomonadota bacterium]